jgi:hypothetical protein
MEKDVYDQQLSVRGNGKIPIIAIEADNLAEATHKAIIACHDYGARIETPKQKPGMVLGRDANMLIRVKNPDSDPKVYFPGFHDTGEGLMQYILEVTHGIHDHWKKSPENPERWGYTYHERFIDQIPFVVQRIKADWDEKRGQWFNNNGRPSGREYQFAIWRAGEDIVLEQPDAPCWQLGQLRFLQDEEGNLVMNYQTNWRSRDLLKAWNENNVAQVELMKSFRDKIQSVLQVPIKLGSYTDHSDSLHLYGLYYERDGLEKQIEQMKGYTSDEDLTEKVRNRISKSNSSVFDRFFRKKVLDLNVPGFLTLIKECWLSGNYKEKSMGLDQFFMAMTGKEKKGLKRFVGAQLDAESKGYGLNQSEDRLKELGYNLENFTYPGSWDSWDPKFDLTPNPKLLARVE